MQIENEVRRVASQDPRVAIDTLEIYEQENGILVELQVSVTPYNNQVQLGLFFDRQTGTVSASAI
jgi:hypothetical protein